mgnify:CR=1 FL=1
MKNEINKLKDELLKANKIISNFNNLKKDDKVNNNMLNDLKETIKMKDKEIADLKNKIKNSGGAPNLVDFNNIIVVDFISLDQNINCGIKCLKTDTFAEVEEKLYQRYEKYRDSNNNFFANGNLVLRFKKIYENGIKDGDKIQLIKIE